MNEDLNFELTQVVDVGEKAVVRELFPDHVQLDAKLWDITFLAEESVAQVISLLSEAHKLRLKSYETSFICLKVFT